MKQDDGYSKKKNCIPLKLQLRGGAGFGVIFQFLDSIHTKLFILPFQMAPVPLNQAEIWTEKLLCAGREISSVAFLPFVQPLKSGENIARKEINDFSQRGSQNVWAAAYQKPIAGKEEVPTG